MNTLSKISQAQSSNINQMLTSKLSKLSKKDYQSRSNTVLPSKKNNIPKLEIFKAKGMSSLQIKRIIRKLLLLANIDPCILLYGYILMKRAREKVGLFNSPEYVRNVFTACVFISFKFLNDRKMGIKIGQFCQLVGLQTQELIRMEAVLLADVLDYRVSLGAAEICNYFRIFMK